VTATHSTAPSPAPASASLPADHVPAEEALDHLHAADKPTTPAGQGRSDLTVEEAARSILAKSVHIGTGNNTLSPRPGQVAMIGDIVSAITRPENDGQAAAIGPTGVGKSLVYLSAAAASWACTGRRSVVSTESLALQAQITDKDAPVVAQATTDVTGLTPKVAVLKGWSNYTCTAAVVETANDLLDEMGTMGSTDTRVLAKKFATARKTKSSRPAPLIAKTTVRPMFGSDTVDPATAAAEKEDLVAWAIEQVDNHGKHGVTGDKNSYEGNLSDTRAWESVSVASSDCLGADKCPFSEQCLPRLAREKAAEADIIVTNHTLLGVQTANDIPVVIGSKTLGQFDHLFIDEAHGLPSTVRSQGSVEVSARAVKSVAKTLERTLDDSDKVVKALLESAESVATYVGSDLDALGKKTSRKDPVVRLAAGQSPLENADSVLERWLKQAADILKQAKKKTSSHAAEIALRRAESRVAGLLNALELVCEDKPGSARWVEVVTPHSRAADQSMYAVARYTPVDVAPMLRYSLYTREMTEEETDESGYGNGPTKEQMAVIAAGGSLGENTAPDGPKPRKPLSVVALSATLPAGFTRQAGLKAQPVAYPSPFDTAYGNSVLFVPRTTAQVDIDAVSSDRWGQKKFDTERHRTWATGHMLNLVAANGGSALVLAATAASGKVYAEALRKAAAGRWQVLSQWDGVALRRQVQAWKDDTNAVLVGTRSLMTGVDASGETCTLVIVDRPPRAASNPVDDARVEMLVNDAQMNRYTADRLVYVSDAGELLEQAAGRLIRSVNDYGMCAVLDPRLLKSSPFAYKPDTRNAYLECLHRFEERIADPTAALAWLSERRDARVAGARKVMA
jgi:ATP-dependent DNA helicase DinG